MLLGVAFDERLILNPGRDWRIPAHEIEGIFIASDSAAVKQRPWEVDNFLAATQHTSRLTVSPRMASLFQKAEESGDGTKVMTVMDQVRRLTVQYSSSQLHQGSNVVNKIVKQGGHVLLCTDCEKGRTALDLFVKPLRAPHLQAPSLKPIVVLSAQEPEDWSQVLQYDDVYYMRGNMLCLEDMMRACFDKAAVVVMLHSAKAASDRGESNPYMVDADVLFSMRQVEARLSKVSKVLTVADIALESNGEYLSSVSQMDSLLLPETLEAVSNSSFVRSRAHHPLVCEEPHAWASYCALRVHVNAQKGLFGHGFRSQKHITNLYATARFASGQLMVSSVFVFLLVNAFHKPKDIRLIAELNAAEIQLRKIPTHFVQHKLRAYMVELLQDGIVCLGLYRNRTRRVASTAQPSAFFVSTTPNAMSTVLQEDDYAYCLVSTFKGFSLPKNPPELHKST